MNKWTWFAKHPEALERSLFAAADTPVPLFADAHMTPFSLASSRLHHNHKQLHHQKARALALSRQRSRSRRKRNQIKVDVIGGRKRRRNKQPQQQQQQQQQQKQQQENESATHLSGSAQQQLSEETKQGKTNTASVQHATNQSNPAARAKGKGSTGANATSRTSESVEKSVHFIFCFHREAFNCYAKCFIGIHSFYRSRNRIFLLLIINVAL